MIGSFEQQYMNIGINILENGTCDGKCRQGNETLRIPCQAIMLDDIENETPILKSKKLQWKSAIQEILWIMKDRSNNIHDLKPHIWDKYADEHGSIGRAYGAQVNGIVATVQNGERVVYNNQIKYVLDTLEKDSTDRRCIITLWNRLELDQMALNPCCHTSTWNLDGGKLNCLLDQRSGDYTLGVPFNTFQYSALMMMFARALGVNSGRMLHVIADVHIYDNCIEQFKKQVEQYKELMNDNRKTEELTGIYDCEPKLVLNYKRDETKSAYENFMSMKIEDFELVDYKSMPKVDYELN